MALKTAYLVLMTLAMSIYPLPQILAQWVHSQAQKYNVYAMVTK